MTKNVLLGLLALILLVLPLFAAACEEEITPPAEEEEEQPPAEEEEVQGDWWDELGEPQYGGTLVRNLSGVDFTVLDPGNPQSGAYNLAFEVLFNWDWTVDPDVHPFKGEFIETQYYAGQLAESWEQTDPLTVTVHLREGVYWQDKPPVNGREFTADDVVYNYDRLLGTGSGFTEPIPFYIGMLTAIDEVVATDTHTVVFHLNQSGAFALYQVIVGTGSTTWGMVAPESVQQGDLNDWENNVVGTGPWMVTDHVEGVSLTYTANPDYYGYDERHPENQLPYITTLKLLSIADSATALAGLRTGTIDMLGDPFNHPTWQDAYSVLNTNPEIQVTWWPADSPTITLRCDTAPFNDIRVRKALQMAIDRELIAESYYGDTVDGTPAGLMNPIDKGWCTPYDQWPAELQAEYSYDPDTAMALLAEAAADGVFEPNDLGGFDTNIVAADMMDLQLLQIIQSQFLDIGVNMEIQTVDMPTLFGLIGSKMHDQMVYGFGTALRFGPLSNIAFRTSSSGLNASLNNDATYDALYAQLAAAGTMEEAQLACIEADMYALRQHWAVNTFPIVAPMLYQPWIKGYNGEYILGGSPYFARWWIDSDIMIEYLGEIRD